jgi:hypothetical protein
MSASNSNFLFLESISPTFYWRNCANILAQIKSFTLTASTEKLCAKLLYQNGARKILVKLTPVHIFTRDQIPQGCDSDGEMAQPIKI